MKLVLAVFASLAILFGTTACGTLGGAVEGAGQDLQKAGNWIKSN